MSRTVYDEFVEALGEFVRSRRSERNRTHSQWVVTSSDPLVIEDLASDVTLEEGGPDVALDRSVLDPRPNVGDVVHVVEDGDGWIVGGVLG